MVIITRELAICMFYAEKYTESNVEKLNKIVDSIEICYLEDQFFQCCYVKELSIEIRLKYTSTLHVNLCSRKQIQTNKKRLKSVNNKEVQMVNGTKLSICANSGY